MKRVVARLATLGYTSTEADRVSLEYLIPKCELDILANINHRELPDGLFYTLVEMAAGQFLSNKKAAGDLEGFDFDSPVKSITEGDISVPLPELVTGPAAQKADLMRCWIA